MTNAEKYAGQIAKILVEAEVCPIDDMMMESSQSPDGWPDCEKCIFNGVCTSESRLKDWLLMEVNS